jgi:hypothetical protein
MVPGYSTLCIHKHVINVCPSPSPSPTPAPTPTPLPTATPTIAPTETPSPVPTASPTSSPTAPPGKIVWQTGTPGLDNWTNATDGEECCPIVNGTQFSFDFKQHGQTYMRQQMLPLTPGGSTFPLTDGATYWFSFDYGDYGLQGQPPGMGDDKGDAQRIFWQIHGLGQTGTPYTQLGFGNTPPNSSTGQPQEWVMSGCGASHSLSNPFWTAPYTPGEKDHFDIQVLVSETSNGFVNLYRNHQLVASCNGPTYFDSPQGPPFWNAGPYVWRWSLANEGGSLMTEVQMLLDNLTVRIQQ